MSRNQVTKALSLLMVFTMLSGFVSAFTVTSPIDIFGGKLELTKKEIRNLTYYVQMSATEGNAVEIQILDGANVVKLNGPNIIPVSPNTITPIDFTAQLPKNSHPGKVHNVVISFRTIDTQNNSSIGINILSIFDVVQFKK